MKYKKAATSISILLLVIMALVLSGVALVSFMISKGKLEKISDVRVIESVYSKAENIKFLVSQRVSPENAASLVVGDKNNYIIEGQKVKIVYSENIGTGRIGVIYEFEVEK